MGDFTFRRLIAGNTPDIADFPAHAALEAGDLASIDASNRLAKVLNASALEDIVLVLNDAAAQDDRVLAIWATPDVVLEGTMKGTLGKIGDLVAIDVTSNVITVEAVAAGNPAQFVIIGTTGAATVLVKRHSGGKVT